MGEVGADKDALPDLIWAWTLPCEARLGRNPRAVSGEFPTLDVCVPCPAFSKNTKGRFSRNPLPLKSNQSLLAGFRPLTRRTALWL